jgi:hypothetical protein
MFGQVLTTITGIVDKRFTLNSLLPTFLVGVALILVWETTGEGLDKGADRFAGLDGTSQWMAAILAIAIVAMVATVLASQTSRLMSWYSGTSGPATRSRWNRVAVVWFWKQRRRRDPGSLTDDLPPGAPTRPAPTALGNVGVLTADYAKWVYGMELATVWPRLLPLIPAESKTPIESAESSMEQAINLSALAVIFAIAAEAIAVAHDASILVTFAIPLGALVTAYLFYRSSLANAELWGEHVRTALDLHRGSLLDALQLPRPATTAEERPVWTSVSLRLRAADDRIYALVAPPK